MPTIEDADTYNSRRGYADWVELSDNEKSAALFEAGDYIQARYPHIGTPVLPSDIATLTLATFVIARDIALNGNPLTIRAVPLVKKESSELGALKESTEYQDAPVDPYPFITALLSGITISSGLTASGKGYSTGRQRL